MQTVQTIGTDREAQIRADVARLVELIEAGRVEEARELAPQFAARWPDSKPIQHMARVLELPKVTIGGKLPRRDRSRENAWLKEHAREYPGCWLAVLEDCLVAAGPRFGEVLDTARSVPGGEEAILFYSPSG